MNKIDIAVIIAYLIGTTLFGCSFFFRRKEGGDDADRAFMTGGGTLPTWAIALSVFATYVSSISFLTLPEGAYGPDCWRGWVNSITVPIATLVAAVWFIPFYRKSTDISSYTFLERRYGVWARIYSSVCFLVMQSARSGVILLLLAILVNQFLGISCETIIVVTGVLTMLYAMMGGFAAVVWADAIQSIILIGGTLVCVGCLLWFTPDVAGNAKVAWDAGKMSLGSFSLSDWGTNTFWVLFFYSICINLQNFGVDQCYTQRYVAAKSAKAAAKSIFASACIYVPVTLLFTIIGTLLWMYNRANPGEIPEGIRAAAVFPWFIVNKLPTGVSGLLVAAIIAAAMSTIAATLNSGSTVLLEDYWKRFAPTKATPRTNLVFLRTMTVVLTFVSVGIARAVVWCTKETTILSTWWVIQGVASGGMLGLFLLSIISKRSRGFAAGVATLFGLLTVAYLSIGQKFFPLPKALHVNLAIVLGTIVLVTSGLVIGLFVKKGDAPGSRPS